jgi:hypothetical protein
LRQRTVQLNVLRESPRWDIVVVINATLCSLLVHAFVSRVFPIAGAEVNCPKISVTPRSFQRVEGSKALATLDAAQEKWAGKITADTSDLWKWCLAQQNRAA